MKIETHTTSNSDFHHRFRNLRDRNGAGAASEVQVTLLVRALNILITEDDPARALNGLLVAITKEMDAHSAALWTYNSVSGVNALYDTTNGHNDITSHCRANLPPGMRIGPFKRGGVAYVMDQGPLVIRDAPGSRLLEPTRREWMAAEGIRSLFCIPLPACGDLTGVLTIRSTSPDAFETGEEILGNLLSLLAGLALQSMRLSEHAEESAVLKERERFAGEIHDGLTQNLAAIVTRLELALDAFPGNPDEAFAHVRKAQELARDGVTEARRAVWALAPMVLTDHDLPGALGKLSSRLSDGARTNVTFSMRGTPRPLSQQAEANLLRVTQEAIHNAVRHGQASKIQITLVYAPENVTLAVEDNGRGFEFAQAEKHHGFGLFSLRERTLKSGGNLTISSSLGGGTRILVEVPCEGKNSKGRLGW